MFTNRGCLLKPVDVAVVLYLLRYPRESYAHMSAMLGISKSSAHGAVTRLERAGLVHKLSEGGARVARGPALEFLLFGVPYAFAPELLPRARGVPTGFAAPGLSSEPDAPEPLALVWPSRLGESAGVGIKPLVPDAPDTAWRDPQLYRCLALVDALRTGDARAREYARRVFREIFEAARVGST